MPTLVRFGIDERLAGTYAVTVDSRSGMVWVRVPGENDVTFAKRLYDGATELEASAQTTDAASFARKLAKFYRDARIPTTVNTK